MVRRLFTEPEAFFDAKLDEPSMRRELFVLALVGVLGAVGVGYAGITFLGGLGGSRDMMRIELTGRALTSVLGAFLLWGYYTAVLQAVAYTKNSRGPVSRVFKITAWSLVPVGISNAVYSVAIFLAYRDEDIPSDPDGTTVSEQLTALFGLADQELVLLAGWIVAALATVYVGYLLTKGLVVLRDFSESDARRVVALPVAGHVAFVLYTMLGQFGVL
jgi:hypothetical protein